AQKVDVASSRVRETTRPPVSLLIVALEPLDRQQVEALARARRVASVTDFSAALDASHAWEFARRPLDVAELLDLWEQERRVGPLHELLEFTIRNQLRETSERERLDPLSSEQARAGAETLAAATALCRQLTFRAPRETVGTALPGESPRGLDAS